MLKADLIAKRGNEFSYRVTRDDGRFVFRRVYMTSDRPGKEGRAMARAILDAERQFRTMQDVYG
jgi:hypothetical protein